LHRGKGIKGGERDKAKRERERKVYRERRSDIGEKK